MTQNKLTRHHICPKSIWWTNNPDNIKRLKDNVHKALHILFTNNSPVEQLWNLTFKINHTALTDEFKEDIRQILSIEDNEYFYKKWILVPKKYQDEWI